MGSQCHDYTVSDSDIYTFPFRRPQAKCSHTALAACRLYSRQHDRPRSSNVWRTHAMTQLPQLFIGGLWPYTVYNQDISGNLWKKSVPSGASSLNQTLFVYRFIHQLLPIHILDGLSHWLPDSSSQRPYLLRRDKCLRLPLVRKNTLKLSPFYAAFSVWNALPDSVRSEATQMSLKKFFSLD